MNEIYSSIGIFVFFVIVFFILMNYQNTSFLKKDYRYLEKKVSELDAKSYSYKYEIDDLRYQIKYLNSQIERNVRHSTADERERKLMKVDK